MLAAAQDVAAAAGDKRTDVLAAIAEAETAVARMPK
jgi:hypothetical protein